MNFQFKHVVVAYVIAALVVNPAIAQQQSAGLIKQQQLRANIEKLSVDRQAALAAIIELNTTGAESDPALKQALNGTTVVDIAAPSAKGVSKNNWNEFNVGEEGIIFNNSKGPVLTQLGGWTDGNRRLAGGEANIILNQVTGANRSNLLGAVEVAGKSAEFILANANGITCNGCGFINTPSVSLITGQSRFAENGDLFFDIAGGDFSLEGKGLNATNIDRFDIVSRYAKINADLYAKNLNVITGVNEFNYHTKALNAQQASNPDNIQFAFDTTALGGMYANTIRLVGTEKGLGVNLQGIVQSTQDLEITADGNLQVKQLQANNQLTAKSLSGSISTDDFVYASSLNIQAADKITNTGFMGAKSQATISANSVEQSGDLYVGLDEKNQLNSTATLTLTANDSIVNKGDVYIGGQLNLTTADLNNQGVLVMQSAEKLQAGNIVNSNTLQFNAQNVNLIAGSITNSGDILHLGKGLLDADVTANLDNTGVWGTNGNFDLRAVNLNNHGTLFSKDALFTLDHFNNENGELESAGLVINAQSLKNKAGRILALGDSTRSGSLNISENIDNTNGIFYTDTGSFLVNASSLDNTSGNFIVNNHQAGSITLADQLINQKGFFQTNKLDINALDFDNSQGSFLTSDINGKITQVNNASGFIQTGQLTLKGNSLDNSGGVILSNGNNPANLQLIFDTEILNQGNAVIRNLNGDIQLTTTKFINASGLIDASKNGGITLNTADLNNSLGSLAAKNTIQFSGGNLNNTEGYIQAGLANFTLTGNLNNTDGVIQSGINLDAQNLINNNGYILLNGNTDINLAGDLQNAEGVIATWNGKIGSFSLDSGTIQNSGELFFNADSVAITSGVINNTGLVASTNALVIDADDLFNAAGLIDASDLTLSIDKQLTNTSNLVDGKLDQGQISATTINLSSQSLLNDVYSLIYATQLTVDSSSVENRGLLIADKINLKGDSFTQAATGEIISASNNTDSMVLQFLTSVTNAGQISRNGNWSITTGNFVNNGRIESLGSGEISANTIINNDLQKIAINANLDDADVDTDKGLIFAKKLSLNTASIDNRQGILIANSQEDEALLISNGTNAIELNNQKGLMQFNTKNASWKNMSLNNNGGGILHLGTGDFTLDLIGDLDNTKGSLISEGNLALVLKDPASALTNDAGLVLANNLEITTSTKIDNLNKGTISGENLTLATATINNNGGIIEANAADQAQLVLNANVNNINAGEIRSAAKDWNMVLDTMNNQGGNLIHTGAGSFNVKSSGTFVNKGVLDSANHLSLDVAKLQNDGQLSAGNQISITSQNGITNSATGVIAQSGNNSNFSTQLNAASQQINNEGYWFMGNLTGSTAGSDFTNSGDWMIGKLDSSTSLLLNSLVNSGNLVFGSSGKLTIDANTKIQNAGYLVAEDGELTLKVNGTDSSIFNDGVIQANALQLDATGEIVNTDTIAVTNNLRIGKTASSVVVDNSGVIQTGSLDLDAREFSNSGNVIALDKTKSSRITISNNLDNKNLISIDNALLDINAAQVINNGRLVSSGDINIDAAQLRNQDQQKSLNNTSISNLNVGTDKGVVIANKLSVTADNVDNNYGVLISQSTVDNALSLAAKNTAAVTLNNNKGFVQSAAANWTLNNLQLTNDAGALLHLGTGVFNLNLVGNLDNKNGSIISDGDLVLVLKDPASSLINDAGLILAKDITVTVSDKIDNLNKGTISGKNLTLTATTINNSGGVIEANAADQAQLNLNAQVNNVNAGQIRSAAKDWNMVLDAMNNQGGSLVHTGSGTFNVKSADTFVNKGVLDSANHLSLEVGQLQNDGQLSAANQLSITTNTGITNSATGVIGSSGNNTDFTTQLNATNQQINNQGYWFSGNQLIGSTNGSDFVNSGKWIIGDGSKNTDINLSLKSLSNTGNISYNNSGNFVITADKVENIAAYDDSGISALNGGVQFNLTGTSGFTNDSSIVANRIGLNDTNVINNGRLQANQFELNQVDLINNGTLFGVNTSIQDAIFNLTGTSITNKGVWINQAKDWTLNGKVIGDGTIYHAGTGQFALDLDPTGDLTGAYVQTDGAITLSGSINGGETTKINAEGNSVVQRTTLVAEKNITITGVTPFTNNGAKLISNQDLVVNTSLINQANSMLVAQGQLKMEALAGNPAIDISNAGVLQAGELSIVANKLDNTNGNISLYSNADIAKESKITLASSLINENGNIVVSNLNKNAAALDSLVIDAALLNNTKGFIGLQNNNQSGSTWVSQKGNNKLKINAMDWVTDPNSIIVSDGDLGLSAKGWTSYVFKNEGNIQALGNILIDAHGVENRGSILGGSTDSSFEIISHSFENRGEVFASNDLTIHANLFNNNYIGSTSSVQAMGNLTLDLSSLTINSLGKLDAGKLLTLKINSDVTINEGEKLTSSGALSITTPGIITNKGEINSKNQLLLDAFILDNQISGKIISGPGLIGYVAERNGDYFLPSEFNIRNGLANGGLISSKGDLVVNTYKLGNFGRIVTGQHQLGINTYSGNLTFNMKPDWAFSESLQSQELFGTGFTFPSTFANTHNGVVYSNGNFDIRNAFLLGNLENASLIAVQNMNLQGVSLQNTKARIETQTGDITLDFSNSIINESSLPTLNEDARAYGYSLFTSEACNSSGSCKVDEYVDDPCSVPSSEMCGRYEYDLARNEPNAVAKAQMVENDEDRRSIWNGIAINRGMLTYTYTASISGGEYGSIVAGRDIKITNANTVIQNNYGTIYAGRDLEINGRDLLALSREFHVGSAPVYLAPVRGDCASTSRPGAPCSYSWNFMLPTSGLEIFNYGAIRAGGNITGTLSGRVVNATTPAPAGAASQNAAAETDGGFTSGSEFKNYLDQALPDQIKNNFYTDAEKADVDAAAGNAESATKLDASSAGSGGSSIDDVIANVNVQGTATEVDPLTAKTLDDIVSTGDGVVGVGSQTSEFAGEAGDKTSTDTSLLNQADQQIADATTEIPELIAKASTTELKTNQWPLISFNVLPFNFDLKNLSGLYVVSQNPDSDFLIETRPEFTEYGKFLGSDYLLDALGYNADKTIKRLGDAFFENQLIRESLVRETNSTTLADITSDYELMQTLMDNAVTNASKLQLSIGVALTPEQSAALTQDMMWLVKKKINGQEVLVPHLYLTSVSPDKIAASKAAMAAGGNLTLAAGSINNQSSINANNLMLVTRGNLQQDGRLFAQGDVRLLAGGDVINKGSIQSNNMLALAQGNVTNSAIGRITTQNDLWLESTKGNTTNTGVLNANNLTLKAAGNVEQVGNLQAKNDLALIAGQDVLLKAQEIRKDANNVNHVVSNVTAGGNLLLDAGRDIQLQASDLTAGGNVNLHADRDVNLQAVKNETHSEVNEKRKKVIDHTVTHDLVNIKSGGNVSIDAGQDANLIGTNIIANGGVRLAADRDVNMSAVVDSDYHFDQTTKKKSFGRKKTTTNETLTETVKGGLVMGGGDVMINAHRNESGEIITEKSGKVNLLGTNIMSGVNAAGEVVNENADVVIAGDEDVNISGIATNHLDFHQTKKKSVGGLKKTDKGAVALNQLIENASTSAGGNIHLISNNNLNLIAADVSANGDINMQAVDQLLIAAGEVKSQTENWKNSSGLFTSNSIYSKKEYKEGQAITAGQASNINAKGNITVNTGSGKIIGSNVVSGGNVYADADMGDIEVTSFQGTMESFQYEKEISVGLGDLAKAVSRPDQLIQNKDGRLTMKFADATYDEIDTKTKIGDNQKSTIQSDGDITLISRAGEVNLGGSDLTANADKKNGGNVNLAGATGVNIDSVTNTQETQTKEVHGSAEMSVVVQHQAVEVVKAVVALDEAKEKLEDAKQQYKDYKRNLSELERQLDQLEGDVKNKVPGVSFDDLVEMRELVEDVKNDEEFIKGGVALAAVNVATATTTVIQQTAAAAASTGTWGFNAGVQLDIAAQKDTTTNKTTTAQASNIMGNQIRIETGTLDKNGKLQTENTAVNINGSNLIATQNEGDNCGADCESKIQIRTGDLNLTASKNTSETSNEHQEGNITAQMTVYGAAGGASISGSYSQSKSTSRSTTHNNTQLNADTIELTTSGDLNILGANVDANKHLEVDVAGDMTVESKQDRSNSRNAGFSVSGGMGFGGDNTNNTGNAITRNVQGTGDVGAATSGNVGVGVSNGSMSERKTVLSTLTSGGTANINVDGHTQNTGALIATVDKDGKDSGKLNFTTGSYDFADLRNNYVNSQTNLNASTSFSVGGDSSNPRETQTTAKDGQGNPLVAGISNLTGAGTDQVLARENNQSKTLATLGHGNITVGGVQLEKDGELTEAGKAEDSPLFMANRDTTATNKSLVNSQYDLSVNASIDTRLFTESGRDAIAEDAKTSKDFGADIWNTGAQILEKDNLNALHYMSTLDTNAKATQVINEVTKNEQLVAALKSDDAATQAAAQEQVAKIAQEKFGMTEEEIAGLNFYDGEKTTSTSLAYVEGFSEKMGGVVVDKNSELAGTIHIMANDKENMLNTVGQEVLEKVTYENGSSNNAAQEARTEILGSRLAEGINKASGGRLNATSGANFVSDFKNSDLVIAGTGRANAVGSSQVDNRQLETEELKFIKQQAPIYAARHEGMTEEEARGILTKQALSMVDARWKKRLSEDGFTGDPDAEAFLKNQAGPQVVTLVRKDGTHTQGMLTSTDEQFQDFYYNSYQSYMAEKGILDNPAYHATYNPMPHLIDDEFRGWLNQYAVDGKVTDLDANFIAENEKDSSQLWDKSTKLIDEKGWSVIPFVGGKLVDSVGNAVDTCKKGGLNCFIPTTKIEGDGFEKAYMDKLAGDQEHYSDNLSKGFWNVGLTLAEVGSLGLVSIPKKAGKEIVGEVVDIVDSSPKNYHEILNVAEDASPAEIKNAYRRAASENHPDRNPDPQATTKMQEINEAYEALSGKSNSSPIRLADTDSPTVKRNSDAASPATVKRNSDSEIVADASIKVPVAPAGTSRLPVTVVAKNDMVQPLPVNAVKQTGTTPSPVNRIDNKNTGHSNESNTPAIVRNTVATSALVVSATNTANHAKNAEALLNSSRNSLVNNNSGGLSNRMDNVSPGTLPKTDTRDLDYADAPERNLLDDVLAGTNQSSNRTLDDLIRNTERPNTSSPLDDAINQNRLLDEKERLLSQLDEMDKNPPAAGLLNQSIAETERNALLNRLAQIEQSVKRPDAIPAQIGKVVDVNKPEVIKAANDIIKPEIKVVKQANGSDIYLSNDKEIPGTREITVGNAGTNSTGIKPIAPIQAPIVQRPTNNIGGEKPVVAPVNIQVPDNAWPQPYPPAAEGSTRIAEIERIKINQVTGAFQGEVKDAIVDRKVAEIQAILNGAPGAAKELPVVRMAPDPVNPNGLVLTDQTHTYAAYVKLGFDEIPASVYNETNGVPFLIKQHAYNTENYAPIGELRNVPEFTGTPAQQAAKRRAELEAQKNKEAANTVDKTVDKTADPTINKQQEILPNDLNTSPSGNAVNNKITSPTEDMLSDPYHPDWKRYDGPEKQDIGAARTRETPSPVIGAEGKQVSSLSRDTKLVRYEPKNASTPMQPHESDYFDVSKAMEYGLKPDNYNALFVVTADRLEELTKLREKQGYFDQDVVLRETTLGELMDEFPNASVLEDYRFNGTLLGADSEGKIQQGSYIIVTKKDQPASQAENKPTDIPEKNADTQESASNIPDSFWDELEAEHAEFIPGPYIDPAWTPEKQTRRVQGRMTDLMISPDHKNAEFVENINELVASTPTKSKRHVEFVRNGEKFEGVYDGLDQNGQLNFILANNERLVVNLDADELAIERMPIYLRSSSKLLINSDLHPEAAALIERIHQLPVSPTETKYVRLTTEGPNGVRTVEGSYDVHDARGNLTLLNIEKINQGEFGSEAVTDVNLIDEKIINAEVLILNHGTNTLRNLDVEKKPGFLNSIKNLFTGKSDSDNSTNKLLKPTQDMLDNPYHPDWKRYDGPEKQSIGASKVDGPNDSNPNNPDSMGFTDAMREAGWLDIYNPSKGPEHYKHLDAKFHNDPYGSVYITESAQRASRQLDEILEAVKARTGPVIDTNVPDPTKSFREIIEKEKNSLVSSTLMSNPTLMNEIENRLGKDRQFGFAGAGHSAIALSFIDANGQKQILRITDKTPSESMPESPYISPIKGEVTFENIRLQITEPVAVLGDFMEDGPESIKVHQYLHAALYRDGILFDDGHEFNYGMTRDGRLVVIDLDAVIPINTIKQKIDDGEITYRDSRAFYETLMNSMEKEVKLLPKNRRQHISTSNIDTDLLDEFMDKNNNQAHISKKSHLNLVVDNSKEFDKKMTDSQKTISGELNKEIYGKPVSRDGNHHLFYFKDDEAELPVADVVFNPHNDHMDLRYDEINEELYFGAKSGANSMAVILEKSLALRKRKPESISIVIDSFNNREFIERYKNAVVQSANTGISQDDLIALAFNDTAVGQLAKSLGYKLDVHTIGVDRAMYSEKGDLGYIQIPAKVIVRYEKTNKPDLSYFPSYFWKRHAA